MRVVLRVQNGAELPVRHADEDPLGRGLPHRRPSFELDGAQPRQEIDNGRPLPGRSVEHAELRVQVM